MSPNMESSNVEIFGWLKTGDQPLIFCNVICIWEFKMNIILKDITFRRDEHDTSPCSFESVGSIEIHHLVIRYLIDASEI
jgi:hypothetical protein